MFDIEKGIEMPRSKKEKTKYPFSTMVIGDSVLFEVDTFQCPPVKVAMNYARRNGKKFSSRKVEGGIRIWRTR
jgi:hypothetical protein